MSRPNSLDTFHIITTTRVTASYTIQINQLTVWCKKILEKKAQGDVFELFALLLSNVLQINFLSFH